MKRIVNTIIVVEGIVACCDLLAYIYRNLPVDKTLLLVSTGIVGIIMISTNNK